MMTTSVFPAVTGFGKIACAAPTAYWTSAGAGPVAARDTANRRTRDAPVGAYVPCGHGTVTVPPGVPTVMETLTVSAGVPPSESVKVQGPFTPGVTGKTSP